MGAETCHTRPYEGWRGIHAGSAPSRRAGEARGEGTGWHHSVPPAQHHRGPLPPRALEDCSSAAAWAYLSTSRMAEPSAATHDASSCGFLASKTMAMSPSWCPGDERARRGGGAA